MKLYHYGFKKEILTEGLNSFCKHPDTAEINNLIHESFGECFGRDVCVFLNLDRRDNGYLTVSVDSEKLDPGLLNVADQDIADRIYSQWYRGNDCSELVNKYVSSIMKLEEYEGQYENPEVFYSDDIPAEILTIEYLDEESINQNN